MCGIAGFFGRRIVGAATVEAMFGAIARRGPDASHGIAWDAAWRRAPLEQAPRALLHTRLSIRDPRPVADQPMGSDDGQVWLSYNGEIYGWEDEATSLAAAGAPFRTSSDTEFILRGYRAWGLEGLLPRLRGMFAFALLDVVRRRLYVVRDRLGLKPLVYYHGDGEFAFGSLVRAVLPYVPVAHRAFAPEGIDAYLAHRYIPAPMTVFRHVARLENAHYLEYDLDSGRLEKRRYWQATPVHGDLEQSLDEAIVLRTVADRPVGVFLSSGIDSSVIASRLAANGYANIRSFTASFTDPALDESALAAQVARSLGMPNSAVPIPNTLASDFPRIVADLDEPFADPSSFPTWYLARETTKAVKVVLCGDGGDELFGGYKRYRQHLRSAWRRHLPALGGAPATLVPARHAKLRDELALDWAQAYSLRFSGFTPAQRRALQPAWAAPRSVYWRGGLHEELAPLQRLLAIDADNYLPEYILRKADLMTMAHGLEARAPLLDHPLVACIAGLSDAQRFTQPAKRVLAPLCDPCRTLGLFEQKKRGFNPPLRRLLRTDLGERLEGLGGGLQQASDGQLDAAAVDALVAVYDGDESLAEQILQLVMLQESLSQLAALRVSYP